MTDSYDIAVIGAGPAGMSAAITASAAGARVVVLDDKPGPVVRFTAMSPTARCRILICWERITPRVPPWLNSLMPAARKKLPRRMSGM